MKMAGEAERRVLLLAVPLIDRHSVFLMCFRPQVKLPPTGAR